MKYTRKLNKPYFITKVLNFNQKALPDPNIKYTTMDKFIKQYSLKSKLLCLECFAFHLVDKVSIKKKRISLQPIIYSEKDGYKAPKSSEVPTKKEDLVIPFLGY